MNNPCLTENDFCQLEDFDECLPKIIKNSDLMVTESQHATTEDERFGSEIDRNAAAMAINQITDEASIQFVEDLEEIEAENDLYYFQNANQAQQQFQR